MKFKYLYKVLSLGSAFISGGSLTSGNYWQALILGVTSIAFIVVDSRQGIIS